MYTDCEGRARGFYRSRRGWLFGVCRGLAERLDISVAATRVIVAVAFYFTGFWPVGALYLLAAVLMKKAPALAPRAPCRYEASEYVAPAAASDLGQTFDSLDKRLQRIETVVTTKSYDWDERLDRG